MKIQNKTSTLRSISCSLFLATLPLPALANVSLPDIFSDRMVLQADASVPIWGWADPGENVKVSVADQTKTTQADANGKWQVQLDKMKPGVATTLTVEGNNSITINDVLVGEVWFCGGQSNMALGVGGQERNMQEINQIRFFTESSPPHFEPSQKPTGKWVICSPESIKDFSGTAYFFGRNLYENLQQPIGLIVSAVGGSPIEKWLPLEFTKNDPALQAEFEDLNKKATTYNTELAKANYERALKAWDETIAQLKAEGKPLPKPKQRPRFALDPRSQGPSGFFNGKIAPIIPYAIRGAIWYQGEANASTPEKGIKYGEQFPMLIKDLRARWKQGDFPFAWVQLPKYDDPQFAGWRQLRESQLKTLSLPNTGMVVTADMKTTDPTKIHPTNKLEVGRRLSVWALAKVYGKNNPYSGPIFSGHEVKGNEIICSFKHTDGGLQFLGGEPKGFLIAGSDKKWFPATARIEGDKVIVSSPEVSNPVAVRYAWENVPECNFLNGANIAASPFRTDDWVDPAPDTTGAPKNPAAQEALE
jgi:sialate O-acetylesterase